MSEFPDDDILVAIYGGKCQECGHVYPDDNGKLAIEFRKKRDAEIDAEWKRRGRGEWLQQKGWPRRYPAWLVREGFKCTLCDAPSVLLALTPGVPA